MSLAANGLLNPTVDDVVRLAIFVLSAVNVVVLLIAVRTLRRNARLLLDMEQFVRETRQAARRLEEERASRNAY
ncbi:MAG TPA: hypothetical protein VE753_07650 [Gaiellaceae bacterium]|nr:hypothetical protein [Gaiellaceae bacterium]